MERMLAAPGSTICRFADLLEIDSERLRLWMGSFSPKSEMDDGMEIEEIARKYEMSGGAIMNVVRFASLMALNRGSNVIRRGDVVGGIRHELHKYGKTL